AVHLSFFVGRPNGGAARLLFYGAEFLLPDTEHEFPSQRLCSPGPAFRICTNLRYTDVWRSCAATERSRRRNSYLRVHRRRFRLHEKRHASTSAVGAHEDSGHAFILSGAGPTEVRHPAAYLFGQ